jgi:hypothetical protein
MRPRAYLIVAAGQRLYAPTLEELAEIAEWAIERATRSKYAAATTAARGEIPHPSAHLGVRLA